MVLKGEVRLIFRALILFCFLIVSSWQVKASKVFYTHNSTGWLHENRKSFCGRSQAAAAAHGVPQSRFVIYYGEESVPMITEYATAPIALGGGHYEWRSDWRASMTRLENGKAHLDDTVADEDLMVARSLALERLFRRYRDMGMDPELLKTVRDNSEDWRYRPESFIMIKDEFGETIAYLEVREVLGASLAGLDLLSQLGVRDRRFTIGKDLGFFLKLGWNLGEIALLEKEFEIQRLYISPKITSQNERNFLWEEVMSVWLKNNYLDRYPDSVFWALATDEVHRRYHMREFGLEERRVFRKKFTVERNGKVKEEKRDVAFLLASTGAEMASIIEAGSSERRQDSANSNRDQESTE